MTPEQEIELVRAVGDLHSAIDELAYAIGHQAIGGMETIARARRFLADAAMRLPILPEPPRPGGAA